MTRETERGREREGQREAEKGTQRGTERGRERGTERGSGEKRSHKPASYIKALTQAQPRKGCCLLAWCYETGPVTGNEISRDTAT